MEDPSMRLAAANVLRHSYSYEGRDAMLELLQARPEGRWCKALHFDTVGPKMTGFSLFLTSWKSLKLCFGRIFDLSIWLHKLICFVVGSKFYSSIYWKSRKPCGHVGRVSLSKSIPWVEGRPLGQPMLTSSPHGSLQGLGTKYFRAAKDCSKRTERAWSETRGWEWMGGKEMDGW